MTGQELEQWRERMGWSKTVAAKRLGLSRQGYYNYVQGKTEIPTAIDLACAALIRGIGPWPE